MKLTDGFCLAEIEQAAVSALMQWPDKCFPISEQHQLSSEHFGGSNRVLFDCVSNFWREGKPLELVSFTTELRELGLLDRIGGAYYLTQTWCNTCYSPMVFGYYAELLLEAHAKRSLVTTCNSTISQAQSPGIEGAELVKETIAKLEGIPLSALVPLTPSLAEAVQEKIERLETGVPDQDVLLTGLTKLDNASPLRSGDLALIVGERKAGKSILALTICANIAKTNLPVLYFSLEDRLPKVVDRLFSGVSRLPTSKHHFDRMNPTETVKAAYAAQELSKWQLTIRDDVYDLPKLIAVAREEKVRNNIGLMVVDYAHLVRSPGNKDQNRQQEVASVSRQLRFLAMETHVPILLLSQLNEAGATRESRALEQDATACWQISTEPDEPNKRWLEIPWQRNGKSGIKFPVTFIGEIARVENYEDET
jgi:replicative DNA helicase